jgi:hypothetical protein
MHINRSVILALVLGVVVALGMPAQAIASDTGATVTKRTTTPSWVSKPSTVTVITAPRLAARTGATDFNVDFKFWSGGWQIKFNWYETKKMARGFSYCTAVTGLLPSLLSRVVGATCGILWILSDIYMGRGDCARVWVPVSLINPSISSWNCSH